MVKFSTMDWTYISCRYVRTCSCGRKPHRMPHQCSRSLNKNLRKGLSLFSERDGGVVHNGSPFVYVLACDSKSLEVIRLGKLVFCRRDGWLRTEQSLVLECGILPSESPPRQLPCTCVAFRPLPADGILLTPTESSDNI